MGGVGYTAADEPGRQRLLVVLVSPFRHMRQDHNLAADGMISPLFATNASLEIAALLTTRRPPAWDAVLLEFYMRGARLADNGRPHSTHLHIIRDAVHRRSRSKPTEGSLQGGAPWCYDQDATASPQLGRAS